MQPLKYAQRPALPVRKRTLLLLRHAKPSAPSLRLVAAALQRILAGCAARGGGIPAVVFDRRATKHPAKIRAALWVGAVPAPRRVAGSFNRSSAIRLASALRVIRRRSQRCYTSLNFVRSPRLAAFGVPRSKGWSLRLLWT